jgi:bile acid-coenzyme A ligase
MGRFDSDGHLYLHDRRPDTITVGGVNVYPAEDEAAPVEHEQVLTAVVIGPPGADADTGNRLHAIVHTPEKAGVTADGFSLLCPLLFPLLCPLIAPGRPGGTRP